MRVWQGALRFDRYSAAIPIAGNSFRSLSSLLGLSANGVLGLQAKLLLHVLKDGVVV
jgi:hypothetical protein